MKYLYWNRVPGKFVNKETGEVFVFDGSNGPMFTGSPAEWNETLVETIEDLRRQTNPHDYEHLTLVATPKVLELLRGSVLVKEDHPVYGKADFEFELTKTPQEDSVSLKLFSGRIVGKVVVA